MKIKKILVHLCLLFWAIGPAFAGEPSVIKMDVRDSLVATLENNYLIRTEQSKPLIGEEEVTLAMSEFDPTLYGSATGSRSLTQSTSAFANPEIGRVDQTGIAVGVRQRLEPGTSVDLSFETVKTATNSNYSGIDPEYGNNLTLSVTQPLLKDSGTDVNTTWVRVANNNKAMSDDDFALAVMNELTRTRETYWDMVYLNKELEVREESLERANDFLHRIELKVQVGVLAPIEIAVAQAVVAVREEALIEIRQLIGNTQDAFKALVNIEAAPPGSETTIEPKDEPLYKKVSFDIEKLKETAYNNRPDYHKTMLDLENRDAQTAYYENQRKVKLNLQGAIQLKGLRGDGQAVSDFSTGTTRMSSFAGTYGDSLRDMAAGGYYDFSVGLVVEYPLYNRAAKSRLARSMLERDIARTGLLALRQNIDLNILRTLREVTTAEQRIEATKVSRILQEKKLEAEMKKYEVGASTSFAVLEFQNDLAVEKSKEIKAVIDYLKALARLDLAEGIVLSKYNITLDTGDR